jgi:haloalkane dehalogenase
MEDPLEDPISAADPYRRHVVDVLDTTMAFIDEGHGPAPVLFQHGNPTHSTLWRNVIPHVSGTHRTIAPDLVGMGRSGKAPGGDYRFATHAKYLSAFIERVLPEGQIHLVGHDWGGALLFDWARANEARVASITYMETIVCPLDWSDWPERARAVFQAMRGPAGEEMVLAKNVFIEKIFPGSVLRTLDAETMNLYRRPFGEPGEERRPMLTWPRQLPLGGEPEEVVAIARANTDFLARTPIPKLFIDAEPGSILVGRQRDVCLDFPNQRTVKVKGLHFIQEDSPAEIGEAIAGFVGAVDSAR